MIKNIIFDLGNVLIEYNPEKFISKFVGKKNRKDFYERVFGSREWQDLDRGTLEYDKAVEIFTKDLPAEKESIEKLFREKIQGVLFPIEENLKILKILKEKGYNLYILSNFHKESYMEIEKRCELEKYFDGKIISCDVKLLKPEREIYEKITEKYGLDPYETLFIDDTLVNVESAQKIGISIIHLKEKEKLKEELERVLQIEL